MHKHLIQLTTLVLRNVVNRMKLQHSHKRCFYSFRNNLHFYFFSTGRVLNAFTSTIKETGRLATA